ncbi:hypothetical protein MTR67_047928 [Solanum verrucosum]|uniref:Uncharacterized protein n=1 Tax=Solanum verrucosum TaxID=315347 RepID=A0AAF0ZYP4_SOLVR|nr:hypothetical protein MTR67_047928 [Solanum verrucosum]
MVLLRGTSQRFVDCSLFPPT